MVSGVGADCETTGTLAPLRAQLTMLTVHALVWIGRSGADWNLLSSRSSRVTRVESNEFKVTARIRFSMYLRVRLLPG